MLAQNHILDAVLHPCALLDKAGLVVFVNKAGLEKTSLEIGSVLSLCEAGDGSAEASDSAGNRFVSRGTSDGWLAQVSPEPQEKARELMMRDTLTGLANRALYYQRAAASIVGAMACDSSIGIALLDLDKFKEINDSLGHDAGDLVLLSMAEATAKALGPGSYLARFGGDEFAAVVPLLPGETAQQRLSLAVQAVRDMGLKIGGRPVHVTCSVGCATYPADGDNLADLIKHADIALYKVKSSGRDGVQAYNPAMGEAARRRRQLRQALKGAIANNELHLHYQPQVDANTGRTLGLEALLRWQSPKFGNVPPDLTFQLAQEASLTMELSGWVLTEACSQAVAWTKAGKSFGKVAVNMCPAALEQPGFMPMVANAVGAANAAPGLVEIEVVETSTVSPASTEVLHTLRGMGFGVALDDFGTGYSNLAVLGNLPLTKLKLDKLFLRDYGNPRMATVAGNVVRLAKDLGLTVVMEGVETYEQQEFSRTLGVELLQGYLFSPPLPPETLTLPDADCGLELFK